MKVTSNTPIIVSSYGRNEFSSLDGTSPKAEILAFQKWSNSKGANLPETGIWDAQTSSVYPSVAERYKREMFDIANPIGTIATQKVTTVTPTTPVAERTIVESMKWIPSSQTDKQSWWKKRSKVQKAAIVTTGIVLLGITLYVVSTKLVKKNK